MRSPDKDTGEPPWRVPPYRVSTHVHILTTPLPYSFAGVEISFRLTLPASLNPQEEAGKGACSGRTCPRRDGSAGTAGGRGALPAIMRMVTMMAMRSMRMLDLAQLPELLGRQQLLELVVIGLGGLTELGPRRLALLKQLLDLGGLAAAETQLADHRGGRRRRRVLTRASGLADLGGGRAGLGHGEGKREHPCRGGQGQQGGKTDGGGFEGHALVSLT